MTDESSSSSAPVAPTESKPTTPPTSVKPWALPVGIEDDIEQALVKTAVGALAGGVVGLICFKGGKGTRAASIAAGVGAGLGSTWERVKVRYYPQESK